MEIEAGGPLDQEYALEAAAEAGAVGCALPRRHVTGKCSRSRPAPDTPLSDLYSYHAHCLQNLADKAVTMRRMLELYGSNITWACAKGV